MDSISIPTKAGPKKIPYEYELAPGGIKVYVKMKLTSDEKYLFKREICAQKDVVSIKFLK